MNKSIQVKEIPSIFGSQFSVYLANNLSESKIRGIGGDKYKALSWIDKQHFPFLEWHKGKVID